MRRLKFLAPINLLMLLCSVNLFAQGLPEKEIIGTWVVNNVESKMSESEMTPGQKAMIKKVEKTFLESKFVFQEDKKCFYNLSLEEMAINDGHWTYNVNARRIQIREWNDRNKAGSILMGLQIITQGDKVYFIVEETPFVLEVSKN